VRTGKIPQTRTRCLALGASWWDEGGDEALIWNLILSHLALAINMPITLTETRWRCRGGPPAMMVRPGDKPPPRRDTLVPWAVWTRPILSRYFAHPLHTAVFGFISPAEKRLACAIILKYIAPYFTPIFSALLVVISAFFFVYTTLCIVSFSQMFCLICGGRLIYTRSGLDITWRFQRPRLGAFCWLAPFVFLGFAC
jgi:hypothetical protein